MHQKASFTDALILRHLASKLEGWKRTPISICKTPFFWSVTRIDITQLIDVLLWTDHILDDRQVEGVLFKVPILNFTLESEVFRTMFELPQSPDCATDGSVDAHPIRLDDVRREDFKQLLRVMYFR